MNDENYKHAHKLAKNGLKENKHKIALLQKGNTDMNQKQDILPIDQWYFENKSLILAKFDAGERLALKGTLEGLPGEVTPKRLITEIEKYLPLFEKPDEVRPYDPCPHTLYSNILAKVKGLSSEEFMCLVASRHELSPHSPYVEPVDPNIINEDGVVLMDGEELDAYYMKNVTYEKPETL